MSKPHVDFGYGYFPGGDPRLFRPDEESRTPDELAAHKAACDAWARGEQVTPDFSSTVLRDAAGNATGFLCGSSYGIGTYRYPCECDDPEHAEDAETFSAYLDDR